jgi:hypothetical protein
MSWGKVSAAAGLVSMKMTVLAGVGLEWATRRKSWAGKWAALLGSVCGELGKVGPGRKLRKEENRNGMAIEYGPSSYLIFETIFSIFKF